MAEGDPAGGTIRVLLADDDHPFVESLVPLIERQPELAVVGSAQDGLAAIELAEELHPDAIVIDLHMPLVDGVTAVTRLRRDHPSMCVIALTGDAQPELHRAVTCGRWPDLARGDAASGCGGGRGVLIRGGSQARESSTLDKLCHHVASALDVTC